MMHPSERDVEEILRLPKASSKRKALQLILKNKGNLKHNSDVLQRGHGELVVVRRPEENLPGDRFIPCPDCFGFFQKYDIASHKCPVQIISQKDERQFKKRGEILLREITSNGTADINNIVLPIQNPEIRSVILHDKLIIEFLSYLIKKHDQSHADQTKYIRERARVLAEFLLKIRTKPGYEMISLMDFFRNPSNFDICVTLALDTRAIEKPRKIGNTIRKCLVIMRGMGLRAKDYDLVKDAGFFDELMATEWSDMVSSKSLKKQMQYKMNKTPNVPTSEDVRKLSEGIESEVSKAAADLQTKVDAKRWKALAEALLAQIVCFNKRRAGEASRIKIAHFKQGKDRVGTKVQDEFLLTLPEKDRQIAQKHLVVYSPGKRGRHVPTVFTLEMAKRAELLIATREEAGVLTDNPFMFAKQGSMEQINVWTAMRKFTSKYHVENCTSTGLRKYLATSLQSLNVTDMQMDMITSHMSHDKSVHKQFYRMDNSTIELALVSKLLHHSSKGDLHKFKGHDLVSLPYELSDEEDYEEIDDIEASGTTLPGKREKKERKKRNFINAEEKNAVLKYFETCIQRKKCPLKKDIEKFLQETESSTSWTNVKAVVVNAIKRKEKKINA